MDILIPVLILTGLALVFAIVIVIVNKKLAVKEDPKTESVLKLLAGANCGACGKAGCADFARALVEGKAELSACNATPAANKAKIAEVLGSGAKIGGDTLVVCACSGGSACEDKYEYQGYGDCASIELIAGGRKACLNGCIGQGKCARLCPYDAIKIVDGVAFIEQKKCAKCGICIVNCPKVIMKRLPGNAKVYVACSSCEKGKDVRDVCQKGCIACGICAKVCPNGAITIKDNLPVFDYEKCTACGLCVEKCPRKVIHFID
jgi:electron transport complex protein RnfB